MTRKRVGLAWDKLGLWAKAMLAFAGLFVGGWGAKFTLDTQYVTVKEAAAMQQQITNTEVLFLKTQRWNAESEQFKYRVLEKERALTPLEQERKNQLERMLKDADEEIKARQPKAKEKPK